MTAPTRPRTPDEALLPAMAAAAEEAGRALLLAPRPAPFLTFPEFAAAYREVEAPVAAVLREHLDALRPGVAWTEEIGSGPAARGEAWVVDPIDGAVQFLQDLPYFCVSLALIRDGEPVAAVLHAPLRGETYRAAAGAGATLDGAPVTPAAKADLRIALLANSAPPDIAAQPAAADLTGRSQTALLTRAGAIRNLGPTSWQIADVAAGRLDAFWQYGRDATNLLPGALIAREAGAVVTDTSGAPWTVASPSFLAAAPGMHAALVPLLP
ncbi:inositol monophosphatase family protein [Streptomyces polygonati]|uniref:Inositol monophosphatase family protein n=1 Tax=Streptomyces polygonati TaxID=1617087 RepID=A0ABV8HWP2_9ACTN